MHDLSDSDAASDSEMMAQACSGGAPGPTDAEEPRGGSSTQGIAAAGDDGSTTTGAQQQQHYRSQPPVAGARRTKVLNGYQADPRTTHETHAPASSDAHTRAPSKAHTRTRRTDAILVLTPAARTAYHRHLGCGGTRLADARRPFGDG